MGAAHGKSASLSSSGSSKWRRRAKQRHRRHEQQAQNSVLANFVTSYANEVGAFGAKGNGQTLLQSAAIASGRRVLSQSSASILGLDREMSVSATGATGKRSAAYGVANNAFKWHTSTRGARGSHEHNDGDGDDDDDGDGDVEEDNAAEEDYTPYGYEDYAVECANEDDCSAETCDLCARENSIAWQLRSLGGADSIACDDGPERCELCTRENAITWQLRSTGRADYGPVAGARAALDPMEPSDDATIRFQQRRQHRRPPTSRQRVAGDAIVARNSHVGSEDLASVGDGDGGGGVESRLERAARSQDNLSFVSPPLASQRRRQRRTPTEAELGPSGARARRRPNQRSRQVDAARGGRLSAEAWRKPGGGGGSTSTHDVHANGPTDTYGAGRARRLAASECSVSARDGSEANASALIGAREPLQELRGLSRAERSDDRRARGGGGSERRGPRGGSSAGGTSIAAAAADTEADTEPEAGDCQVSGADARDSAAIARAEDSSGASGRCVSELDERSDSAKVEGYVVVEQVKRIGDADESAQQHNGRTQRRSSSSGGGEHNKSSKHNNNNNIHKLQIVGARAATDSGGQSANPKHSLSDENERSDQSTLSKHSRQQHSHLKPEHTFAKMSPPPPTATATAPNSNNNNNNGQPQQQQQQQQRRQASGDSASSLSGVGVGVGVGPKSAAHSNKSTTTSMGSPPNHQMTMTPASATKLTGQMARQECGLALSHKQRDKQNLAGLLPPAIQEQDLQAKAVLNYLDKCQDELSKYVYLRNLKDFNERLYYYTLTRNVEKLMPLVYTPTVGLACQRFSEIYLRPRGIFITINDLGRVGALLANWNERDVRVIVVTDGERILGLGDLGANGMGISIGKLSLYTALAGIPPQNVLPITIDVGTNNELNLQDPFYIGLRQKRVRGDKYDALLEEFMGAVVDRWGRSCLIQFEDFANSTAFTLLERYRNRYCTFNDDIQGTASVCLSGLISAAKEIGKRLADCSFLFYGAGEANLGTAHLLVMAMAEDGLTKDEAKKRVWLVDSKGLVVSSRSDLSGHKREFAQPVQHIKDLESIIDFVKPSAIIGASAQGGSFNESICKKMAQFNARPIIFALSNPTKMAECTAAQAYKWTAGKCVFASGSPFDPVEYNGKTYITGQGNNAYIFPGVGLAAIGAHTHIIPEETFLIAARALSDQVTSSDTSVGLVYPRLNRIREVTLGVAARVLEYFYAERLANYRPEPSDKREFLRQIQYQPRYELEEI